MKGLAFKLLTVIAVVPSLAFAQVYSTVSSTTAGYYTAASVNMSLYTGTTASFVTRATIIGSGTTAGFFGLGTTPPLAKFQVGITSANTVYTNVTASDAAVYLRNGNSTL